MGNSSTHSTNTDITYTGSNTNKNNSWKETTAHNIVNAWQTNCLMMMFDAWQFFLMPIS